MTGSRRFNGAIDAIRFTLTSPNPTGAITLLAVIKPINVSERVALLNGSGYTPEWGWASGQVYLYNPSSPSSGPFAPTANRWQVFATTKAAGTFRPIHHLKLLDAADTPLHREGATELPNFTPLSYWDLGTDSTDWSTATDWWYEGLVAGFAIFDRVLSNTEIEACTSWATIRALNPVRATRLDGDPPFAGQELTRPQRSTHHTESPPSFWPSQYCEMVMADNPSAYFRLGESFGTTAVDTVGGAAGTYVGTFALGQPAVAPWSGGTAVRFDALTRGYVSVVDRAALDLGDTFTLEAWVRMSDVVLGGIVDKGDGGYILRTTESGRLLLRRNNRGDVVTSTVALTPGKAHHVVATKAAGVAKLYLDGVDVTGTVTNQTMQDTALPLNIGAADAGINNLLTGTIDEVALYKTALTATRVRAHYDAGTGAVVSRWSGSNWQDVPVDVWNGTSWRRTEEIARA
ncbi:LamG domain-containing protein [Conexibacter stalactiti]|uniref:LamG domain-containing protein n=1 Tax=Conexibacter stalactiti TaxID=1940611 RepID=A0ABU4HUQ6_9ACTN|nr:LamG domain-containing protein [Conexibacter stalactiti]MDW5595774.1 LamG domain-containing protein [Conexibacter stalactiti]MEC5036416.1 LamG domain-containing protein [Conexibacter stalactiti]